MVKYVCSHYTSAENSYSDFLRAMQELYTENKQFLKPLLCEYWDSQFAIEYRQVLEDKMRKDIRLKHLFPISIQEEQAYLLASGIVNHGAIATLTRVF